MNDEELRAFLESATVGGPDSEDKTETPARPSFDELIGLRRQQAPEVEADPVPLVLPEPPRASAQEPGVTPLLLPAPGTPAVPRPAAEAQPPTQPLSRADMPTPQPKPAPVFAQSEPPQPKPAPVFTPAPVPATEPLTPVVPTAPYQAPTFASAQTSEPDSDSDYEKIAVTGGSSRTKQLLPWIIAGGAAIIVLVAALFVVNAVRGGGEPATTAAPPASTAPTTVAPKPTTTPAEPTETATPTADQPPQVEVGPTMLLAIPQWGISADLSTRFGQTSYMIDANNRLVLTSALIDSLPESCAAMRSEWGIVKVGDAFEVLKPAERCAAAPEVYDELWGLTAEIVKSIRPL